MLLRTEKESLNDGFFLGILVYLQQALAPDPTGF